MGEVPAQLEVDLGLGLGSGSGGTVSGRPWP